MDKILKLLAIVVSGTTILTACNANQQTQLPEANFDEEYRDEPEEDITNQEHDAEGCAMPEDNDAIGTWCTEGYDEDNNFAMSYMLELKEDGTALCTGYRNRDTGTYEAQGQYAIITFDKCEYDQPGEGYVPQDGAGYTVEMEIQGNEAEIKVSGDYLDTNLSDGKMFRSGGYVRGTQDSKDVADGTYITGEQYTGSIYHLLPDRDGNYL